MQCLGGACEASLCATAQPPPSAAGFGDPCGSDTPCAEGLSCRDDHCECGGVYGSYALPVVCEY